MWYACKLRSIQKQILGKELKWRSWWLCCLQSCAIFSTNQRVYSVNREGKMAIIKFLVHVSVAVLLSLSIVDSCSLDSDCASSESIDLVRCCKGECIDKHTNCPLGTEDAIIALVFVCVVIVVAVCLIYCCCSCLRYRQHSTGKLRMRSAPPYQKLMNHSNETNVTNKGASSLKIDVFYPQPSSPVQQYAIRHPMEVKDDLDGFA